MKLEDASSGLAPSKALRLSGLPRLCVELAVVDDGASSRELVVEGI